MKIRANTKTLFLIFAGAAIAVCLAWAATQSELFTATAPYDLSDDSKITINTVAPGYAQLAQQKPFHLLTSASQFSGTDSVFNDTEIQTGTLGTHIKPLDHSDSRLKAYWSFNNASGDTLSDLKKASPKHDGRLGSATGADANDPGWDANGYFGPALNFTAANSDYVNVTTNSNLDVSSNAYSFSAWIKTGTASGTIIFRGDSGEALRGYKLALSSGLPVFTKIKPGGASIDLSCAPGTASIADNAWHHVAAVSSAYGMYLYIDGVLKGSNVDTTSFTNPSGDALTIGKSGAGNYFNGWIDDLAIYNASLTDSEVAALAGLGHRVHMKSSAALVKHSPKLSSAFPGLVSYWPLDASLSGTSTIDAVGRVRGTLTGSPTYNTGINGQGISLTGANYVALTDFSDPRRFTISAWVKPTGLSGTQYIFEKLEGADTDGFAFLLNGSNPMVRVGTGGSFGTRTSNVALTANVWTHLAATYDGTSIKIYINGTENVGATNSGTIAGHVFSTGTTAANIGTRGYNKPGTYFTGMIDEVALFNRALGAQEVAYLAGLKGETAVYLSPELDGEHPTATKWDKFEAVLSNKIDKSITFSESPSFGLQIWDNGASFSTLAGIDVGDIDRDGDMDVVAVSTTHDGIRWFGNNGSGQKISETTVGTLSIARVVKLVDVGLDGDLDVIGGGGTTGTSLRWYRNNDGVGGNWTTFNLAISGFNETWGIDAADVNGDGHPDIVAGAGVSGVIGVWLYNTGTSSYPTSPSSTVPSYPAGGEVREVIFVDLDNDGDKDIAAAFFTEDAVYWWENPGNGNFASATRRTIGTGINGALSIAAGDIDGDYDQDLVVSGSPADSVYWFRNDHSVTPYAFTIFTIGTGQTDCRGVSIGDVDGDGDQDVVALANGAARCMLYLNANGAGTSWASITVNEKDMTSPSISRIADMDGDGNLDIAVAASAEHEVYVFTNSPWSVRAPNLGDPELRTATGVDMGDIDGDGDLDIVVTSGATASPYDTAAGWWYRNDGGGNFATKNNIACFSASSDACRQIALGDLDEDGDLDVVIASESDDHVSYWRYESGDFTSTTGNGQLISSLNGAYGVKLADFNNDGKLDVVMSATFEDVVQIRLNGYSGSHPISWASVTTVASSYVGVKGLGTGDINGDGNMDVIFGANAGVYWRAGNGNGGVTGNVQNIDTVFPHVYDIAVGDIDRDGRLDVIAGSNSGDKVSWWRNDGGDADLFSTERIIESSATGLAFVEARGVVAADIDGDGDLDVAATAFGTSVDAKRYSQVCWWENTDGLGKFGPAQSISDFVTAAGQAGQPHSLSAGDLNQDGRPDIVVTGFGSDQVYIFYQEPFSSVKFLMRRHSTDVDSAFFMGPANDANNPYTYFSSGAGILQVDDNLQKIQYKAAFYRNDSSLDPQIESTRIDYRAYNYSTKNPYVTVKTGAPFSYWTGFTETALKPAGSGIEYQFSADGGNTWRYYNGSAWAPANPNDLTTANTASELTSTARDSFDTGMTSNGILKVRTLLSSNGTALPQLNQLDIATEEVQLGITAPTGATLWKMGTSGNAITWSNSKSGVLPSIANDLKIEYTPDGVSWYDAGTAGGDGENGSTYGTTHSWTIPAFGQPGTTGLPSSNVKIRVRSASAPAISAESATFKVTRLELASGAITAAEILKVGTAKTININKDPAITGGVVEYSKNGLFTDTVTIGSFSGDNDAAAQVIWTPVTGELSSAVNQAKIRVRATDPGTTYDSVQSDPSPTFTVADIVIDAPISTDLWQMGTSGHTISWTTTPSGLLPNSPTDLVIAYSTDNFASDVQTVAQVNGSNTSSYVWDIPLSATSLPSGAVKVRVKSAAQPFMEAVSAAFKISKLQVTAPNGGEFFKANSTNQSIQWIGDGLVTSVKLEYSPSGTFSGDIVTIVASTTSSSGPNSYSNWTVPATITDGGKIRVTGTNAGFTTITDASNNAFTVADVAIVSPNGSEQWQVGSTKQITWSASDHVPNDLVLEYSTNGATWSSPIQILKLDNSPATGLHHTTGTPFDWRIPDNPSSTVRVRVRSASRGVLTDQSAADFKISKLQVTSPNGSESWPVGSSKTITWNRDNLISNVKLEYSILGDFSDAQLVNGAASTANDGTEVWNPLPNTLSNTTKIRVTGVDAGYTQITDASDNAFLLVPPVLTVTEPSSSDVWPVASTQTVQWSVDGVIPPGATVTLSYQKSDLSWTPLATGTQVDATLGSISWPIPLDAVNAAARIKIEDDPAWTPGATDGQSDAYKVTPKFTITRPNGNEKWAANASHVIRWQTQGAVANVKLEYSKDNTAWTTISASTANDGLENWTPVDADAGATIWIRVSDVNDPDTKDVSDASFKISSVTVTSPSASGTRWPVNSVQNIQWNATAVSNVKIEFSKNGTFSDVVTLAASTTNDGSEAWPGNTPLDTTAAAKIRVSDADAAPAENEPGDTALATDVSDNAFALHGTVAVSIPSASGIIWEAGQPQTISWTVSPANVNVVPLMKIEITDFVDSNNNKTIIASTNAHNVAAGSGDFSWTPDFTSGSVKIKISDASDPNTTDQSDSFFSIGGISIIEPVPAASLTVGSSTNIRFGWTGGLTSVNIYYSLTNLAPNDPNWIPIQLGYNPASNPDTYSWTVEDAITSTARILIVNANDANRYAKSGEFTIQGVLNLANPGTLEVDELKTISWTKTGTITSVDLEYSTDGGANWNFAKDASDQDANGLAGTSFIWKIPDIVGNDIQLRVKDSDSGHPSTTDVETFSVKAKITVDSPAAAAAWAVNESRDIAWSVSGASVANIQIEYATDADGYASWTNVSGAASTANDGTHTWNPIPDLVKLAGNNPNPPNPVAAPTNGTRNVKLRFTDLSHTGNARAIKESSVFTVKWYLVTFTVVNEENTPLGGLSVADDASAPDAWNVGDDSLVSGSVDPAKTTKRHYKAGNFVVSWSKDGFSPGVVNLTADSDKAVTVILESENPQPYNVGFEPFYDANTDALTVKMFILKRGLLLNDANLGVAKFEIYSGATLLYTSPDASPDAQGFYQFAAFDASGAGLPDTNNDGKADSGSYFVKTSITYNTKPKFGASVLNLQASDTQAVLDKIGSAADAAGTDSLFGRIAEVKQDTGAISTAVGNVQTAVGSVSDQAGDQSLQGTVKELKESLGVLSDGASPDSEGKSIQRRLSDLEKSTAKRSGTITQRSAKAAPGSSVKLGFRGDTGLTPTADIYDPNNRLIQDNVALSEIDGTGVYEYKWDVAQNAATGDYTAIIQESTTGALDSMTINIAPEAASSGSTAGDVTAATSAAQETNQKMDAVQERLDSLMTKLSNIELVKQTQGGAPAPSEELLLHNAHQTLAQSQADANQLAKEYGVALPRELMTLQKEQGGEIKVMKNDVEKVRNIVEAIKKSVGSDKPVIQQWMEAGSVILKVLAINPSKDEAQDVPMKIYLPVEAKPENVLNRDEVTILFDTAQNLYYAEKNVTLKPGESFTMMVHIEDIWTISADELKAVRDRADKAIALLPPQLMDVAKLLYNNVTANLEMIDNRQRNGSGLPQEHIATYRNNVKLLEEAMKDLNSIEQLLVQSASSSLGKDGQSAGREGELSPLVSTALTWKLMMGIIIFLAVVSAVSFAIWSKQLKDLMKPKEINMLPPEERAPQ